MDLLKCLFDRPCLEAVARQFRLEAEAIEKSKVARPVLYEQCGRLGATPAAQDNKVLKPQTINECRKAGVDMSEPEVQLGRFFQTDELTDDVWLLQYKFLVVLYLSDVLMELVQRGSPKAVSVGFLRHFRAYFERHLCGAGSASKKKGQAKTTLTNTEPLDFVISEILRLSRLHNAR